MNKETAIELIRQRADAIKAEGATSLYIYGSRARGDYQPTSDIDIFVEYDPDSRFSLIDLAGIKILVEEALGLEVDITTRNSLHPDLKSDIESQSIRVL